MGMPIFPRRDPAEPDFWDLRYEARFAPWESGRVPAKLRRLVAQGDAPGNALVPGCGSARDVAFLAESGWNVLGLDFSAAAVEAARAGAGLHAARIRQGDFFAPVPEAPFALVYERAFLCALPRRLRPAWGERVAQLVEPGGRLAGFFHFDTNDRGPPFGLSSQSELDALLGDSFERAADEAVDDSIPVFAGKERWQVWRRIGSPGSDPEPGNGSTGV